MFTICARAFFSKLITSSRQVNYKITKLSILNCYTMFSSWNCIYIPGPDRPVYLKRRSLSQNETESRNVSTESKLLLINKTMYVFFPKSDNSFSCENVYVQSAIQSHKAYRQNGVWRGAMFAHAVIFDSTKSEDGDKFRRGVFCTFADEFANENDVKMSEFLSENDNLMVYKLIPDKIKGQYKLVASQSQSLNTESPDTSEDSEFCLQLVNRSELRGVNIPEDETSPIFFRSGISPVFHDYKTARRILEQLSDIPEVKDLIHTTDSHITTDPVSAKDQTLIHPFIVVEGMDATGKTTLTEELEKRMGAVRYFTPPAPITSLRPFFDKWPEIVRRAYYSMGNYIVAKDIIKECQTRPVIMDRFWHSTAAYGIANETSLEDMPDINHPVYRWPEDLLKPTIVLFLTVSEDVRKQRLSGRGVNPTFEEKSLDKDQLFRKRLCESYRHMREPSCVEIDASGTVEEVRNMALEVLNKSGVKLDDIEST